MADYLQRLVNRANGLSDAQSRMTPFFGQWTGEHAYGNENPFENISQTETLYPTAPASNGFEASAKDSGGKEKISMRNEALPFSPADTLAVPTVSVPPSGQARHRQAAAEVVISPKREKLTESKVETEPMARQRSEHDDVKAPPANPYQPNTRPPTPQFESREPNSVLSSRQAAPEKKGLLNKKQSLPSEQPHVRSQPSANTGADNDPSGQTTERHSQNTPDRVTTAQNLSPSRLLTPPRTTDNLQNNNTDELRPRIPAAPSEPLRLRGEHPRLIIGHLQVDVVPAQPESPPPQQVQIAPPAERSQSPSIRKLSSKLRFGLGQL